MDRLRFPLLAVVCGLSFVCLPAAANAWQGAGAEEFNALLAKREQFQKEVEQAQTEFQKAAEAHQKRMQKLFSQYAETLLPEVGKAAAEQYAKEAGDLKAEEVTLEYLGSLVGMSSYADALTIINKLMEARRTNPGMYSLAGMAKYAQNDFARADQFFKAAQKQLGDRMHPEALQTMLTIPQVGAQWKDEQALRARDAQAGDLPQVVLRTDKGDIYVELFETEAPNTVANFISLVDAKYYDGTKFHRVVGNFVVQAGDPNTKNEDPADDGQGGPGYRIPCECYTKTARKHFQGTLSMAHAGKDTGGSQFFITHRPAPHLNPQLDETGKPLGGHTVFGRVIKGMEVVLAIRLGDTITLAKTLRKKNHAYKPKTLPTDEPPKEN